MASLSLFHILHPSPPPRLSFIRSFLRTISTTPRLQQEASALIPLIQPQGQSQEPHELLSYHVNRTPSQQLPVYHLAKRGGNLKQTRIRKISGDIAGLRQDLQQALGLKEEHIVINQLTRHIIIKGWKRTEVAKFLQEKRF